MKICKSARTFYVELLKMQPHGEHSSILVCHGNLTKLPLALTLKPDKIHYSVLLAC